MRRSLLILAMLFAIPSLLLAQQSSFESAVQSTTPRMVKIFGSGGFRGLEAWQSGSVISSQGHVLTVWSYVLDSDEVNVVLDDGQRFKGKLMGYDPRLEIAVLKDRCQQPRRV